MAVVPTLLLSSLNDLQFFFVFLYARLGFSVQSIIGKCTSCHLFSLWWIKLWCLSSDPCPELVSPSPSRSTWSLFPIGRTVNIQRSHHTEQGWNEPWALKNFFLRVKMRPRYNKTVNSSKSPGQWVNHSVAKLLHFLFLTSPSQMQLMHSLSKNKDKVQTAWGRYDNCLGLFLNKVQNHLF